MKRFTVQVIALVFTVLLSACGGSKKADSPPNILPPANASPTVDAGADQMVNEAVVVTIQGVGGDADGSVASYSWTEISGSTVAISGADTATATFDAPTTATRLTLTFELTVTDNQGATATDVVTIIVDPVLVTQSVVAGEALILTLDTAELVIPADALDVGVQVSLSIVEPETLADSPVGPEETLISPIYELTFSSTKIVSNNFLFSFNYPENLSLENLYARLKIEGGLFSEGVVDSSWFIVFDKIASSSEQISVELSATATRFLIVGIDSGKTLGSDEKVDNPTNASNTKTLDSNAASNTVKNEVNNVDVFLGEIYRPAFADHGWIIACDPKTFEDASNGACDPSHPDYFLMLNSLGEQLYKSDKTLTALGFPIAETEIVLGGGASRHIIYDPDDRSTNTNVTFEKPGNVFVSAKVYHLAWVSPPNEATLGVYYANTKRLIVNAFEGDDTAIHELMHAVQYYEMPTAWNIVNRQWITEGLADSVIPFSEADTSPSTEEYRTFGDWRDWSKELSSTEENEEYEVSEFWLSTIDSSLFPLADFYNNFASKGPFENDNGYVAVDQAMTESGLPTLGDNYKALIVKRNFDERYPYCESVITDCDSNSCEIVAPASAISASCFDVEVSFETCDGVEDVVVTLESPSGVESNPKLEMMLDGNLYASDTEVGFSGQGRLWAINTDYSVENSIQTAVFKFKNKSNCYVKLLQQEFLSSAVASADIPFSFVSPKKVFDSQIYHSEEDPNANNYIGNYHLGTPDKKAGWEYRAAEPLGLAPYQSSHAAHAMSQFPEGAAIDQAFANSYLFTDTDSDAISMTTMGEHEAMASIVGEPISGTGSNTSEYHYIIGNVPIELTLTWACTMSRVRVTTEDPEGIVETIFRAENIIDNDVLPWECGTKKWTISPNNILKIYIATIFEDNRNNDNEHHRDAGGIFEINLSAILGSE